MGFNSALRVQVLETCENGRQMIDEQYPQSDTFQDKIDQLMAEWNDLKVHLVKPDRRPDEQTHRLVHLFTSVGCCG